MNDSIVFVETNASGHGIRALTTAHDLGLSVHFLTSQRDFYKAGGIEQLAHADQVIEVDTTNVAAMLDVIDAPRTAGVITFLDYPLLAAAELAKRLDLPHPTLDGLAQCRFKDQTRQKLGEPRPKFRVLGEDDRLNESPFGYPVVVKPVDDSGSVGVRICGNAEELREALQQARSRFVNARNHRLARRWLVEEYIEGPEYSVELLCVEGEWRVLGITRKLLSPPPFCVEIGHVFPAGLPSIESDLIARTAVAWLDRLGLRGGAAHVELRLTANGPVLMEVNPRLGGDMIPELIRITLGLDPVAYQLAWASGRPLPVVGDDLTPKGAAAITFFSSPSTVAGAVAHVQGVDALERLGCVVESSLPCVGASCRRLQSSYDRLGYVIVRGDDPEDAAANALQSLNTIELIIEPSS